MDLSNTRIVARLKEMNVWCEPRSLPIGDYLWIGQGIERGGADSDGEEKVAMEVLLGTVIERKTSDDLKSSLFGTRYNEQKLRLQNATLGASQVMYLLEANSLNHEKGLVTAMYNTMIKQDFVILRTRNLVSALFCCDRMISFANKNEM